MPRRDLDPRTRVASRAERLRCALLSLALVTALPLGTGDAQSRDDQSAAPIVTGEKEITKWLGLGLRDGDTIALVGNALAERMQHDGHFETALQLRFPLLHLRVRNLGFGADEVAVHQRTMNFGKLPTDPMELDLPNERFVPWDRYLDHVDATVVFAFFGFNESFAGEAGVPAFRRDLGTYVDHVLAQRYDGERAPRLVLFSSIPFEDLGDAREAGMPDPGEVNARIERYNAVIADVARARNVPFVDLYAPMARQYELALEPQTVNGIHLNRNGNFALAAAITAHLSMPEREGGPWDAAAMEALRRRIVEKNDLWFERYRATDGYNVYGGRSRLTYQAAGADVSFSNYDVLQREMAHLDAQVAERDRAIWAAAAGKDYTIDDSKAPPLIRVLTNKLGDGPEGEFRFLAGRDAVASIEAAPGMHVELFADERQFPELVNPVQMSWDTRGRLWVAVWPTYPHWTPGQPRDDKLLILEDTDGDGRANTCTTFAGDLHNPTGFEFWSGGVLVAAAPDLLFLKDVDGDDRYDTTERLLHGLSSADTHHSANSFVLGPDGALYFQEGTFHMSQVESIHGPVRNQGGCVWRYEPRTHRVERYVPYGFANPHGHVFDRWGQDFVTDGTGNVNYYALPFSGQLQPLDSHRSYFPFFQQRSRPAGGTEILSSAHFPDENQGNYLIANVIGFRGVFQYEVEDDGSGFDATEVAPIVESSDPNFRPVDLEVGPDGALYVLDWHNPLIGHMQHHLRDPSRDDAHGRIYRVTYEGRPPSTPARIAGASIDELLELLKSREDRVRYRARIELSGRDSDEVVARAEHWYANLDPSEPEYEHHALEALWLHLQHDRMDVPLLVQLLDAQDPRARAAATRVLRYGRHLVPDTLVPPGADEPAREGARRSGALALLAARANDPSPRVRLEAVVAASFFPTADAASVALESLRHATDPFLEYALRETMRGLEPYWKEALRTGGSVASDNPAGLRFLLDRVTADELVHLPHEPEVLRALLTRSGVPADARLQAARELAELSWTNDATQVVEAIRAVDAGSSGHAAHVVHDLAALFARTEPPERDDLIALARDGKLRATRATAYAAWIALDGAIDDAWALAAESSKGLTALLDGAEEMSAETLAALAPRVRPLLFPEPDAARERAGTGLAVAVYEPAPSDATKETVDGLAPKHELRASTFTLDLAPVKDSDSFGVAYRGVLFVPSTGTYTFATESDDGSRLYLDGECVVDNDGAHSMAKVSGTVDLTAGPHPVLVTFFEAGGAEGLTVTWSGPGFDEREVEADVLGTDDETALRSAAARALARVPGLAGYKLEDAGRLFAEGLLIEAATDLVASVSSEAAPVDTARETLDALTAYAESLAPEHRTLPAVAAALAAGRRLAEALPGDERATVRAHLADLGGTVIVIRTKRHEMRYDLGEFWVEAGKPVSIVFQNNDVMPHNLVVTMPGAMADVGQAAELLSASAGARSGFVPASDAVLWHTRLLLPGESERLAFVAPEAEADHPYVCTYPGHWRVMNGVMHVVAELREEQRIEPRDAVAEDAEPVRPFVRDWTLADLAPRLVDDWESSRSLENGRALFDAAGCIKCHTSSDLGPAGTAGGPDLTGIREKYDANALLSHVLEPSLEVLDEYRFFIFERETGADVVGRIVSEDEHAVRIIPTLLEPDVVVTLDKDDVVERFDARLSPMPTGLLVTLTESDILDLLAFLRSSAATPEDAPSK